MRVLLELERPPGSDWDLKLLPGGLVDIEFAAQFLQLVHAAEGGPLVANTAQALAALGSAGLVAPELLAQLSDAWRLQQNLTQLLKVALGDNPNPAEEPKALQMLLARAGDARTFRTLVARLTRTQADARRAYQTLLQP